MPTSANRLFPAISKESIAKLSETLAKSNTATSAKAEKFVTDFQHRPTGVYYRAVDDMRAECSRLNYAGKIKNCSASVISSGPAHQTVYAPNWLPAVGFLISGDVPTKAISRGLFLETPQGQLDTDIDAIRSEIVSRLKQGDTSTPHQPTQFYAPRQTGVNEAHIHYTPWDLASYSLPLRPNSSIEAFAESAAQTGTALDPSAARNRAENLRLAAALAYAVSTLGVKPIFAFGEGKLEQLKLSQAEWTSILSNLNTASTDEYLLKVAQDPADYDRPKATGLTHAAEQLMALEKTIDPQALKHIGGNLTSIPVDVVIALASLFPSSKSS